MLSLALAGYAISVTAQSLPADASTPPKPATNFRLELLTPVEGTDFKSWIAGFTESLRITWGQHYRLAEVGGAKGIVITRLTLLKNGQLVPGSLQVEYPSGNPRLDDLSTASIASTAPFQPLPDKFAQDRMDLRITFRYSYLPDAPFKDLYDSAQKAIGNQSYLVASQLLEVLVDRDPDYTNGWNLLGWVYNKLGKYDKAAVALQKAIQENPRDPLAYDNLGQACFSLKKYDEAVAAYRKQLEINKNDKYAHTNLGRVYLQKQDYPKAVEELEASLVASPKDAGIYYLLGTAYAKSNQPDKAKEAFKKSVELEPLPMRWNNVAYEMARANLDLPTAEIYATSGIAALVLKMRETSLDQPTADDVRMAAWVGMLWDTLGWILFEEGKIPEAKKYILAAWQLRSAGVIGYHLARIYEADGHTDQAIQTYLLSLAALGPDPDARVHLAKLLGGDTDIDKRVDAVRPQLTELRTVRIPNALNADGIAEFWILQAPGPKVLGTKFITGDDVLQPYAKDLESASFPNIFPEATDMRLLRRGRLTCIAGSKEPCRFLFASAESVRTTE